MYKFIYGMDIDNKHGSIKEIKEHGFDAIVFNLDEEAAEITSSLGMDYYIFSGAYSSPEYNKNKSLWSEDINGKKQLWFDSTCPNREEVRMSNLENARRLALAENSKGVFLDGARFSSPGSSDDEDAFFTCFCEVCEKKALKLGFDFQKVKKDVKSMYIHYKNNGIRQIPSGISWDLFNHVEIFQGLSGVYDWFCFRRVCTSEHIINFSKTVKQEDSGKTVGIYIFTPSLAPLVGQNYYDINKYIDIFSPMIYRSYKPDFGPACLNREIYKIAIQLKKAGNEDDEIIFFLGKALGFDLQNYKSIEEISEGLPVSAIHTEVKRAENYVRKARLNIPIILLDDDNLGMSIDAVRNAGADGICFFQFERNIWNHSKEVIGGL